MKPKHNYFTTKNAFGHTFCNRVQERKQLRSNIEKGEHTVIVAPRRYGKTSLACQTLSEIDVDFVLIDLFCVVYIDAICEKITKGISHLVKQLMPLSSKTLIFLSECFKNINLTLNAGEVALKLEYCKPNFNYIDQLSDVFLGLEKIAATQNKRVVVFFDEFQDLLKVERSNEIQAAIRFAAQHSKYTSFVFSGSSRHLLKEIFDDSNQPLYMLCNKIHLIRISKDEFSKHLQNAAKRKWKIYLESEIIDNILTLTELHPFYVNMLCGYLWDKDGLPTIKEINLTWDRCLIEQRDKLIADLEPLNTNRLKVLSTIAFIGKVVEPNSKAFCDKTGMPLSSLQKSLEFLLNNDYIYTEDSGAINIVDPLLKRFIVEQVTDHVR